MFNKYLQPYVQECKIAGFNEFISLLNNGVAYHHAGMLPILREYVELLFQENLLEVVFATETLGVGINMPAKTVVMTTIERPNKVTLNPEEFWQMSGRAGRRGMDDKGFVLFHPISNSINYNTFSGIVHGKMRMITSQIVINPMFVLRKLMTAEGYNVVNKSLLTYNANKRCMVLEEYLKTKDWPSENEQKDAILYNKLMSPIMLNSDITIKLNRKQQKENDKQIECITKKYSSVDLTKIVSLTQEYQNLKDEISNTKNDSMMNWNISVTWLINNGFYTDDQQLTIKGKVASMMSDGLDENPLVRSTILCEGYLSNQSVTLEDLILWLSCFTEPLREINSENVNVRSMSYDLEQLLYETESLNVELDLSKFNALTIWLKTKNMNEVCKFVSFDNLGVFVKCVVKILAYLEELSPIFLGLENYEMYNIIENRHSVLLNGMVTNHSLYIN
jgi:superfamily II RNA helicase